MTGKNCDSERRISVDRGNDGRKALGHLWWDSCDQQPLFNEIAPAPNAPLNYCVNNSPAIKPLYVRACCFGCKAVYGHPLACTQGSPRLKWELSPALGMNILATWGLRRQRFMILFVRSWKIYRRSLADRYLG